LGLLCGACMLRPLLPAAPLNISSSHALGLEHVPRAECELQTRFGLRSPFEVQKHGQKDT